MSIIKCLIIGSGPAGYTAAIYAARAALSPVLYGGPVEGGQLTQTTVVENFPGYPDGVEGFQMMTDLRTQAERCGAELRTGVIERCDFSARPYTLWTDNGEELHAESVIIATGASAKYLGLPDEEKYRGTGVSACATCDGFFYRKKTVAVVGGGDTACEEALYLSQLCKQVYMVVRKPYLRASDVMQQRIKSAENITVLYRHNAVGLYGEDGVEGMHVVESAEDGTERRYDVPIDGFFLAIGHTPNSAVFSQWIETDAQGYIKTQGNSQKTNIPGVFAAGDICDPVYRQAVVAAGSGCKAALEAEKFLLENSL